MVALLGGGLDAARAIAAEAAGGDVLDVANDNEPTQVVLSGHKSAVDRVPDLAKAHGMRRAMPLPVSCAIPLLADATCGRRHGRGIGAVDDYAAARAGRRERTAAPIADPGEIKERLVEQVTGTVRWRECVLAMVAGGVSELYEIGSGKVLTGLAGRIDKTLAGPGRRYA